MPRISEGGGPSNADMDREDPEVLARQGVLPSVGTSSSTSESKPGWSGTEAPETEQSTQSPAQDAASPSGRGRPAKPALSSTASSTDGSTQGTGQSPESQQDSLQASTVTPPAIRATTDKDIDDAGEMLHLARQAFDTKDYAMALEMLDEAESMDPSLKPKIDTARDEIYAAQQSKK